MARDPGKTLQTARSFPLVQTRKTERDSLGGSDTIDIWQIRTRFRSSLNLVLDGLGGRANADVDLLNERGRVLETSKRRGNRAEELSNLPLEVGTYYVRVKLESRGVSTRYKLAMSAKPLSDPFGNSFEAATPLQSATGTFSDFVGNSDPSDFLRLTPLVAGQFNLNLSGLSDDASLELYDADRNLIFASNNPGTADETIAQRLTSIAGSTYYVRVAQAPGKDANYTLNYSFVADTPIRTSSGLQYIDLAEGTGATPQRGQNLRVHYTGILLDGSKFDSSRDRGQPFSFPIGLGRVIAGWDEGLSTMKVGGRRQLIIPANLAYGSRALPGIPANSTLIFDVELLAIG